MGLSIMDIYIVIVLMDVSSSRQTKTYLSIVIGCVFSFVMGCYFFNQIWGNQTNAYYELPVRPTSVEASTVVSTE
jgi:hypothetical protein